jgi:simple sugar transport system ATP-binding protein
MASRPGEPSARSDTARHPFLSARAIDKAFPGVIANAQVDLDVFAGEVHALLGENGAGKSTLVKILYGFYKADAGEIRVNGRPVDLQTPADARRLGIGMVFQQFTLIPAMTVAENIALFLPHSGIVVDEGEVVGKIEAVSQRHGLGVDPRAPVWRLSVGEQQKVEILKLLLADARLLILDEPTRVLAPHEIDGLFETFANLRRDGYAVIVITHKLREVLACADRVTVLRRGRVAGTLTGAEATEEGLLSLMFGAAGRDAPPPRTQRTGPATGPLLELRHVTTGGGRGSGLRDVSLEIAPAEIVGVAGVSGNGQRELGDAILGLEPCTAGVKVLWGREATQWSVAQVRASGVAYVPEDPLSLALVPGLSVLENMALGDTRRYARRGGLVMDWPSVRADLEAFLGGLSLAVPPLYAPAGTLSGGTLQRLCLARELVSGPKLIVAFYPTRGLDVRSAVAVRELLVKVRNAGAGVLLISEDLDELFSLADRLLVLYRGQVAGTFAPGDTTPYEVGRLMTGSRVAGGGNG